MGVVRAAVGRPVAWAGELIGRHPFRAAGLVAVLGGSAAAALSVGGGDAPAEATAAGLVAFAAAQPAYAAAVVAGLCVLLWPRS